MALAALATLVSCERAPEYVIGFTASLSGVDYLLGTEGRNAAELYVAKLNQEGGIRGHTVRLEARDHAGDLGALQGILRGLKDAGALAVIGAYTSAEAETALPVLAELELPLVSPSATAASLSGKRDWLWRTIMSGEWDAEVLARLMDQEGLGTLLVVASSRNRAYVNTYVQPLDAQGKVEALLVFDRPEQLDCAPYIQVASFDAILIIGNSMESAAVAQELRANGCAKPLFVSGWAGNVEFVRYGGASAEGARFVHQVDADHPGLEELKNDYFRVYGEEPGFSAIETWESLQFLCLALEGWSRGQVSLRQALEAISSFEGPTGTIIMDVNGDAKRPMYIKEVRSGNIVVVGRID